jgi:hypothetical protein
VGSPQNNVSAALSVAGHADVERRLADSFEFQRFVPRLALGGNMPAASSLATGEGIGDPIANALIADDDEIPRLHQAD